VAARHKHWAETDHCCLQSLRLENAIEIISSSLEQLGQHYQSSNLRSSVPRAHSWPRHDLHPWPPSSVLSHLRAAPAALARGARGLSACCSSPAALRNDSALAWPRRWRSGKIQGRRTPPLKLRKSPIEEDHLNREHSLQGPATSCIHLARLKVSRYRSPGIEPAICSQRRACAPPNQPCAAAALPAGASTPATPWMPCLAKQPPAGPTDPNTLQPVGRVRALARPGRACGPWISPAFHPSRLGRRIPDVRLVVPAARNPHRASPCCWPSTGADRQRWPPNPLRLIRCPPGSPGGQGHRQGQKVQQSPAGPVPRQGCLAALNSGPPPCSPAGPALSGLPPRSGASRRPTGYTLRTPRIEPVSRPGAISKARSASALTLCQTLTHSRSLSQLQPVCTCEWQTQRLIRLHLEASLRMFKPCQQKASKVLREPSASLSRRQYRVIDQNSSLAWGGRQTPSNSKGAFRQKCSPVSCSCKRATLFLVAKLPVGVC